MRMEATESERGKRADAWLAAVATVSRSRAVTWLGTGVFTVNGAKVPPDRKIKPGDVLAGEPPAPEAPGITPSYGRIPVVFQDKHLLVVNKPAGLAVHPGAGRPEATLVSALIGMKIPLAPAGGVQRPGIVHRLDKDTTGLVVVAKSDAAYWKLSKMAAAHDLEREYLAIVVGRPNPPHGTIDAALDRDTKHREKFTVVSHGGREAVTHYAVERALKGASYVRLKLETGRTHQIRVHCAAMGWPILGDVLYGGWRSRTPLLERQALHAAKLSFIHPMTGRPVVAESKLPKDMAAALKALAQPAAKPTGRKR
jgi:23S rRNA pseudouridine1911/1915/1917 synthase